MINKDSLICIGYISRPHSYTGEIQLKLERKIVSLTRGDFLFIKLQGQYIPYQILEVKGKSDDPVLKLEFISTYEQAQEICANEVYTDTEVLPEESELSFIGFEVIDKHLGTIGKVEDVQEMPKQLMLLVNYKDEVRYIPLVDDFIDFISTEEKEIWLTLPNGLLDI
jgi:16S rRNA processing protein RimM